jgi:hypothetical protein
MFFVEDSEDFVFNLKAAAKRAKQQFKEKKNLSQVFEKHKLSEKA